MVSHRSLFRVLLPALLLGACSDEPAPPAPAQSAAPPPAATAPASQDAAPRAPETGAAKPPSPPPAAAESAVSMAPAPATVLRETELKDRPYIDAKTLRRLPEKTSVVVTGRSGGWLQVVHEGREGWARLLHVSMQPAGSGGVSTKELESIAKLATGRAGGGNIVSTTGIRGLDEEELRRAQPNEDELRRLESYGADDARAAAYARTHGLERRQIAHLPAPR